MVRNVKKQRPVNLDLQTIRFPITAIASILHRVSGVITFVAIGILLWLLGTSLSSPEGFLTAASIMDSFFVKFIMWGILTALAYHAVVGIRHLLKVVGYYFISKDNTPKRLKKMRREQSEVAKLK